jgi:hypothetical protein
MQINTNIASVRFNKSTNVRHESDSKIGPKKYCKMFYLCYMADMTTVVLFCPNSATNSLAQLQDLRNRNLKLFQKFTDNVR